MSHIIGAKKKDYLSDQAPLGDDEYDVIIEGTNGLLAQLADQNPLTPLPALMGGVVGQPVGAIRRIAATVKLYREKLTDIAARDDLPLGLAAEINALLHPAQSTVIPASGMPPLPDLSKGRI